MQHFSPPELFPNRCERRDGVAWLSSVRSGAQSNQRKAGGFSERALFVVKREKTVCRDFKGDGHMEKVHPAHHHLERVKGSVRANEERN